MFSDGWEHISYILGNLNNVSGCTECSRSRMTISTPVRKSDGIVLLTAISYHHQITPRVVALDFSLVSQQYTLLYTTRTKINNLVGVGRHDCSGDQGIGRPSPSHRLLQRRVLLYIGDTTSAPLHRRFYLAWRLNLRRLYIGEEGEDFNSRGQSPIQFQFIQTSVRVSLYTYRGLMSRWLHWVQLLLAKFWRRSSRETLKHMR